MNFAKTIFLGSFIILIFYSNNLLAKAVETECKIDFTLKSWSVFYKSGKGYGTIRCDNGQKSKVYLRSQGGGLTFGKGKITDGHGTFSKVSRLKELYGSYTSAEGHAGVVKNASAQALSKGDVSLTLTGTGNGIDIGFDFGKFTISKV